MRQSSYKKSLWNMWWVPFTGVLALSISCKKLVSVDPPSTALTSDNVYQNEASANSSILGIYASIGSSSPTRGQTLHSVSLVTALSSDELTLFGGSSNFNSSLVSYYVNRVNAGSPGSSVQSIWNDIYSKLYITNIALEKLSKSNGISSSVRNQLTGEARFLRAYFYFYLINLYGDVPLVLSSDYRENTVIFRSPREKVYEQIITDLTEAKLLLNGDFVGADGKTLSNERLRPNKYAAASLLARVYLYIKDWANAEEQATIVINSSSRYSLTDLNSTFLKNSNEAIWQLQPVNLGWNTEDARVFVLPSTGPTNSSVEGYPVFMSQNLLSSFDPNDKRSEAWVGKVVVNVPSQGNITYHYPYKYKSATLNSPITEYEMVIRLAEVYLIRAEARANQNNISGAKSDLDAIRLRAGLGSTLANDKTSMIAAIQSERQKELFTEWGHRWLDLKRTGKIDEVMITVSPAKGTTWNRNWQWYPIPSYDLTQNGNLKQNEGY